MYMFTPHEASFQIEADAYGVPYLEIEIHVYGLK